MFWKRVRLPISVISSIFTVILTLTQIRTHLQNSRELSQTSKVDFYIIIDKSEEGEMILAEIYIKNELKGRISNQSFKTDTLKITIEPGTYDYYIKAQIAKPYYLLSRERGQGTIAIKDGYRFKVSRSYDYPRKLILVRDN
ncbi:hypothetical protein F7734_56150 [Scytonema sp. UIC 10036]|uniref:hypothetical protein n=1 Tax=Scytonema sp. UIC 10036 TaxID=2304196 RepID=UPI0012DA7283|nr:hypothetical protein [Scytonema sp. UIC 10036]MUH01110.1 hypothetical protein [Scytonema sp. UIC 10036]